MTDAIHADEIITRSWIVWMKYCSNESWSKVLARIGNWSIRHGQYLKRQIVGTKGKKPSGWKIRKQACHDHHQPFRAGASTSADIPGPQGSRAKDQETPGRRKLNKSCAEKVKGTEDEVDVETERPRWTERSARNAEPAGQANPVQRSSWCDRKQRHGWIAARRSLESDSSDINCNTTSIRDGCKMQHHWRWRAGHWSETSRIQA